MSLRLSLRRSTSSIAVLALTTGVLAAIAGPAQADDPVAGALTASPPDSLFPNQGNGGYDVSHYDIDLAADFTTATANNAVGTSTVDATATITASTTGAPLSSYSFDFQGSTGNLAAASLNVSSVTVDGVPATFSRIETTTTSNATTDVHKLVVTPATAVSGTFTTVVEYAGRPVAHTDTDGSSEGWNNTTDGATFLNQPVGSMTLFPNNNTPRDTATYRFTLDVPSRLSTSNLASAGGKPYASAAVSNGELVSRTPSQDGSRTTWVWAQQEQMASELSMVSVGRYDVYSSDITLASGRMIPEWTFIDPAISTANQTTTLSDPGADQADAGLLRDEVRPLPGQEHRPDHRRRAVGDQLRARDPGPPVLGHLGESRHVLPRDHAPVVGRQRGAVRLERHLPQRGSRAVLGVPVPLRGSGLQHHQDRARRSTTSGRHRRDHGRLLRPPRPPR